MPRCWAHERDPTSAIHQQINLVCHNVGGLLLKVPLMRKRAGPFLFVNGLDCYATCVLVNQNVDNQRGIQTSAEMEHAVYYLGGIFLYTTWDVLNNYCQDMR